MDSKGQKDIKTTTIRIPTELFWRFKTALASRHIASDEEGYRQAIQQWVEGGPTATAKPHPNDRWHQMLADVLASGDHETISAVTQNILVFHRIANPTPDAERKKKTEPRIRSL